MRLASALLLGLVLASTAALAGETYSGGIHAQTPGGNRPIHFTLDIEKLEGGSFSGEIVINGLRAATCGHTRKVTGRTTPEGLFQFKTDDAEIQNCGLIQFKGKQEGSDVIGNIKFMGKDHEMTLNKK